MRDLCDELGFDQMMTPLWFDSSNCIKFMKDEKVTKRTIHIGVKYFRCRQHHGKDFIAFYRNTKVLAADALTKALSAKDFNTHISRLMHDFTPMSGHT